MNSNTQTLIDKFLKSARNAYNAKNRAQREAAQTFLIKRADELRERRDALYQKLERRWDALDADPDMPNYEARETRTIDMLHEYEAICDALSRGLVLWLHEESEEHQRLAAVERLVA